MSALRPTLSGVAVVIALVIVVLIAYSSCYTKP